MIDQRFAFLLQVGGASSIHSREKVVRRDMGECREIVDDAVGEQQGPIVDHAAAAMDDAAAVSVALLGARIKPATAIGGR